MAKITVTGYGGARTKTIFDQLKLILEQECKCTVETSSESMYNWISKINSREVECEVQENAVVIYPKGQFRWKGAFFVKVMLNKDINLPNLSWKLNVVLEQQKRYDIDATLKQQLTKTFEHYRELIHSKTAYNVVTDSSYYTTWKKIRIRDKDLSISFVINPETMTVEAFETPLRVNDTINLSSAVQMAEELQRRVLFAAEIEQVLKQNCLK